MSNPILKTYHSYYDMIVDFASMSSEIDVDKTLTQAPALSFYTKDGRVALGGNFVHFLVKLKEETGIKVNAFSSEEHLGYYIVSFEDYAPVAPKEPEKLEVKPVDTPAKKKAARIKS